MPTSPHADEAGSVDPTTEPATLSPAPRGSRRRKRRKARTVLHVLGATVLVMALVSGLSVVYLYRHLSGNIEVTNAESELENRPEVVEAEGPKQPLNVLIMGSDARFDDAAFGQRSDTTILLHVSADRKRAYGISIPRDSLVNRPACRKGQVPAKTDAMWNEAFSISAGCTMQQFEQLTDIRLDHHVIVDFPGFKDMVNAVGGVNMCIPEEIVDEKYLMTTIPAGKSVKLQGQQALDYVRVRHGVGDGSDISRAKRQQAFIAAMANKVLSAEVMTNPIKLISFLDAATKSLHADEGLSSPKALADLALEFKNIGLDDIQFITIPINYYPVGSPNSGRVYWTEDADLVWKAIRQDKPIPEEFLTGVLKAGPGKTPTPSLSPSVSPSGSPSASPRGSPSESPSSTPTKIPPLNQYNDPAFNGLCG